jgi:hypothetical protein
MIHIALTPAAFGAVVATLPFGSIPYEPQPNEKGERVIWLDENVRTSSRGNRNAIKHGEFAAKTLALKREIRPLPGWPGRPRTRGGYSSGNSRQWLKSKNPAFQR